MSTATATGTHAAIVRPGPKPASKRRMINSVWGIVAWVAGIVFVFPVIWMVLSSLKEAKDVTTNPPVWFFTPTTAVR